MLQNDKATLIREIRRLRIKHVTLDYDGEPVTLDDGKLLEARPPYQNQVWNSENLEWEDSPQEDQYPPLDKNEYDYWAAGWNGYCIP